MRFPAPMGASKAPHSPAEGKLLQAEQAARRPLRLCEITPAWQLWVWCGGRLPYEC